MPPEAKVPTSKEKEWAFLGDGVPCDKRKKGPRSWEGTQETTPGCEGRPDGKCTWKVNVGCKDNAADASPKAASAAGSFPMVKTKAPGAPGAPAGKATASGLTAKQGVLEEAKRNKEAERLRKVAEAQAAAVARADEEERKKAERLREVAEAQAAAVARAEEEERGKEAERLRDVAEAQGAAAASAEEEERGKEAERRRKVAEARKNAVTAEEDRRRAQEVTAELAAQQEALSVQAASAAQVARVEEEARRDRDDTLAQVAHVTSPVPTAAARGTIVAPVGRRRLRGKGTPPGNVQPKVAQTTARGRRGAPKVKTGAKAGAAKRGSKRGAKTGGEATPPSTPSSLPSSAENASSSTLTSAPDHNPVEAPVVAGTTLRALSSPPHDSVSRRNSRGGGEGPSQALQDLVQSAASAAPAQSETAPRQVDPGPPPPADVAPRRPLKGPAAACEDRIASGIKKSWRDMGITDGIPPCTGAPRGKCRMLGGKCVDDPGYVPATEPDNEGGENDEEYVPAEGTAAVCADRATAPRSAFKALGYDIPECAKMPVGKCLWNKDTKQCADNPEYVPETPAQEAGKGDPSAQLVAEAVRFQSDDSVGALLHLMGAGDDTKATTKKITAALGKDASIALPTIVSALGYSEPTSASVAAAALLASKVASGAKDAAHRATVQQAQKAARDFRASPGVAFWAAQKVGLWSGPVPVMKTAADIVIVMGTIAIRNVMYGLHGVGDKIDPLLSGALWGHLGVDAVKPKHLSTYTAVDNAGVLRIAPDVRRDPSGRQCTFVCATGRCNQKFWDNVERVRAEIESMHRPISARFKILRIPAYMRYTTSPSPDSQHGTVCYLVTDAWDYLVTDAQLRLGKKGLLALIDDPRGIKDAIKGRLPNPAKYPANVCSGYGPSRPGVRGPLDPETEDSSLSLTELGTFLLAVAVLLLVEYWTLVTEHYPLSGEHPDWSLRECRKDVEAFVREHEGVGGTVNDVEMWKIIRNPAKTRTKAGIFARLLYLHGPQDPCARARAIVPHGPKLLSLVEDLDRVNSVLEPASAASFARATIGGIGSLKGAGAIGKAVSAAKLHISRFTRSLAHYASGAAKWHNLFSLFYAVLRPLLCFFTYVPALQKLSEAVETYAGRPIPGLPGFAETVERYRRYLESGLQKYYGKDSTVSAAQRLIHIAFGKGAAMAVFSLHVFQDLFMRLSTVPGVTGVVWAQTKTAFYILFTACKATLLKLMPRSMYLWDLYGTLWKKYTPGVLLADTLASYTFEAIRAPAQFVTSVFRFFSNFAAPAVLLNLSLGEFLLTMSTRLTGCVTSIGNFASGTPYLAALPILLLQFVSHPCHILARLFKYVCQLPDKYQSPDVDSAACEWMDRRVTTFCTLVYTALQTAALIRVMADAVSCADTILTETVRVRPHAEQYREYWFTRLCLGDVIPLKPEAEIKYQEMLEEWKTNEAAAKTGAAAAQEARMNQESETSFDAAQKRFAQLLQGAAPVEEISPQYSAPNPANTNWLKKGMMLQAMEVTSSSKESPTESSDPMGYFASVLRTGAQFARRTGLAAPDERDARWRARLIDAVTRDKEAAQTAEWEHALVKGRNIPSDDEDLKAYIDAEEKKWKKMGGGEQSWQARRPEYVKAWKNHEDKIKSQYLDPSSIAYAEAIAALSPQTPTYGDAALQSSDVRAVGASMLGSTPESDAVRAGVNVVRGAVDTGLTTLNNAAWILQRSFLGMTPADVEKQLQLHHDLANPPPPQPQPSGLNASMDRGTQVDFIQALQGADLQRAMEHVANAKNMNKALTHDQEEEFLRAVAKPWRTEATRLRKERVLGAVPDSGRYTRYLKHARDVDASLAAAKERL
jgi:hypothetical protein